MQYSIEQFKQDVEAVKPRFIDTYILPPLMIWYAYKSKSMPRIARRMLFAGGIYAFYRNFTEYETAFKNLAKIDVSTIPAIAQNQGENQNVTI